MLDRDNAAANRLYRMVRKFCLTAKPWTSGAVRVDTTPAERRDITKLAQRVYNSRFDAIAVMAAAGMDYVTQPLEQQSIILPTPEKLLEIKRTSGCEPNAALRRNLAPIWRRD